MPDRALVLDSFALLAIFLREPSGPYVIRMLEDASPDQEISISVVNLGEVFYRLENVSAGLTTAQALSSVRAWPVIVTPVDEGLALAAAAIRAERRMGYLDCFVVALAQARGATVVTGDPDFRRVEDLVRIEWLER